MAPSLSQQAEPNTPLSSASASSSNLMIAWRLVGKHVVIVGGGKEGFGRLSKALACGAKGVTLICPLAGLSPAMSELLQNETENSSFLPSSSNNSKHKTLSIVHHLDREFIETDLDTGVHALGPVDLVLSCVDDVAVSRFIADLARDRRIPVNCADIPDLCDFYFMSEWKDGPLQIGISTGGSGPRLAVRLKKIVAEMMPKLAGDAVANIGILRRRIRLFDPEPQASSRRMRFFSKLCDSLSLEEMAKLTEEQALEIIHAYERGEVVTALPPQLPPASTMLTPPTSPLRNKMSYLSSWMTMPSSSSSSKSSSPKATTTSTDDGDDSLSTPITHPATSPSPPSHSSSLTSAATSLISSAISSPVSLAKSTVNNAWGLVSSSISAASTTASSYLSSTPTPTPLTKPNIISSSSSSTTTTSSGSNHISSSATPVRIAKSLVSLNLYQTAVNTVSHLSTTTSDTIHHVKDVAEIAIGTRLDMLPTSIESPVRSVLTYLSPLLPISIPRRKGKVILVGAGPGDPELLTVKAMNAIKSCDVVISDQLIPVPLLNVVRAHMQQSSKNLKFVPKKRKGVSGEAQDAANAMVLEYLAKGRTVVRLKNGDPLIFGRGGEEWSLFADKGYEVEVVPGVSSAIAAPFAAAIPATYRGVADQVLILTGRGENGVLPNIPEYNEKRTTIVLMPVGRLPELVDAMLEQGYPSTTPSALIEKGTWGVENGEKYVRAPLSNILDVAIQNSIASPAVFVVGDVVDALAHLKRASGGAKELEGVASIKRIPGPYDDISVQPRRKKSVC